jgi:hypothetical protein
MNVKKRLAACALTLLFVFITLSSVAFIILEAEHDCTGEDCPVCYQLSVCEHTLKFGLATAVLTAAWIIGVILPFAARFTYSVCLCLTPVTLKVKLSN